MHGTHVLVWVNPAEMTVGGAQAAEGGLQDSVLVVSTSWKTYPSSPSCFLLRVQVGLMMPASHADRTAAQRLVILLFRCAFAWNCYSRTRKVQTKPFFSGLDTLPMGGGLPAFFEILGALSGTPPPRWG